MRRPSRPPGEAPLRSLTRGGLLRGVEELCRRDGDLAGIVERWGPPPLWGRRPGFATLVRIVLEQQVSLASAEALFNRLRNAVEPFTPERVAPLSPAALQELGLTRQKAGYCHGIARSLVAGDLDLKAVARADDATARRRLMTVRGVGPWTADIYLLMALRRPDVWPEGDLALAAALQRLGRLRGKPAPERLRRIALPWSPWRAVAARILWHLYLSDRVGPRTPR